MDSELMLLIEETEAGAELAIRRQYDEYLVDCFSVYGNWLWQRLVGPELLLSVFMGRKVTFTIGD